MACEYKVCCHKVVSISIMALVVANCTEINSGESRGKGQWRVAVNRSVKLFPVVLVSASSS